MELASGVRSDLVYSWCLRPNRACIAVSARCFSVTAISQASGDPPRLLAGDDLVVFYHLGPAYNLAFDKRTELFRRGELIFDPLIIQTPLDRRLAQSFGHRGIHPHDYVARGFRRCEQAPPGLRVESGEAQLGYRGSVRQLHIALSGGHRDRMQRARLNMR